MYTNINTDNSGATEPTYDYNRPRWCRYVGTLLLVGAYVEKRSTFLISPFSRDLAR